MGVFCNDMREEDILCRGKSGHRPGDLGKHTMSRGFLRCEVGAGQVVEDELEKRWAGSWCGHCQLL